MNALAPVPGGHYAQGYQDGIFGTGYEPGERRHQQETDYASGFECGQNNRNHFQTHRHTHAAGTIIGEHIDTCAICRHDIRADIHVKATPPVPGGA